MPSRNELNARARVVGIDPASYANDSKLEQKILYLEKNATAISGTLATGTLTQSGAATTLDEIEIDGVTYTYVTALSEAKATGIFTVTDVLTEGETVTIEGITYTFRAVPVSPYDIDIGASAAASLDNLKSAINDSGTEGTTYGTGTEAHPLVTATTNSDTAQTVEARVLGVKGNTYLLATTAADGAWGASVMGTVVGAEVAGVDPVPYEVLLTATAATELDNLKQAINAGDTENGLEGEGTNYSTGTRAHPTVTATTNGASTQVVAARDFVYGDTISTTDPVDDGTVLAWGATTLATVAADVNAVAGAGTRDTNAGIAGDRNI